MAYSMRSLAADKIIKKVDGFRARLEDIKIVDGFNVRTDDDELREHVAAIAGGIAAGLPIPPLEVWVDPDTGAIELVDGHCRYHAYEQYAATAPGFDGWVAVARFEGTRAQRKARIVTSNTQLKLKPVELGRAYLDLRDSEGLSRKEIAELVGKSLAHVDQMILLASAGTEVTEAVKRGEISATEAVKLQRDHGADAPAELERRRETAKELGKDKVTAKAANPVSKPSRSASYTSIVDCATVLIASLTEEKLATCAIPKSYPVEVDSLLLADLIDAVRSAQEQDGPLDADKQADLLED